MREYYFMYVVEYNALTWTECARIFYYRNFWHTLSFRPNTNTLNLMISCKGKLRYGTKYAKLAYLLPISVNFGIQKHMALLLSDKVRQLMCNWCTVVCVIT